MAEGASDSDLVVTRWRRFGKDRLYAADGEGVAIGWWDLLTDEPHPENPGALAHLSAAAARWKDQTTPAATTQPTPIVGEEEQATVVDSPQVPQEGSVATMRPWIDLSTNQAGSAARAQAVSEKDAAPVRSVFARVLGVHTSERAWRVGADGEEKVAVQLAKAAKKDPRWRCHPTTACGFPVHVEGLIVTVNAADVIVTSQPEGVSVTPRMQLATWLLRHGDILDEPTSALIFEAARRSSTWAA